MSEIRIKNLDNASQVIAGGFDEFSFAVDASEPDTTLHLTGAQLKEAIGTRPHIHDIGDIYGLTDQLDRNVSDGEDAVTVQILSSGGNNFLNGSVTTTLHAYVFRGTQDVTHTIAPNLFNWRRVSDNTIADEVWNSLHDGVGNEISITNEDIYRKAVFTCEAIL